MPPAILGGGKGSPPGGGNGRPWVGEPAAPAGGGKGISGGGNGIPFGGGNGKGGMPRPAGPGGPPGPPNGGGIPEFKSKHDESHSTELLLVDSPPGGKPNGGGMPLKGPAPMGPFPGSMGF